MMNMSNTVTDYVEPESELLTEDLDILKECDIEEMENVNPLDSSYNENVIAFLLDLWRDEVLQKATVIIVATI